jgi:hypothetical protein
MPILMGGGSGFHPTPNHVIRKRTVNATLAMGHQPDPVPLLEIYKIFTQLQYTKYSYTLLFLCLGKTNIARIDSWLYTNFEKDPTYND